jgi:hypothetical protein
VARYERSYTGERRTEKMTVQLTPTERAELASAAEHGGAPTLSEFARELLFRRLGTPGVVAGTRRNPQAAALIHELNALGNNLNQIARHANTTGELGSARLAEVDDVLLAIKRAASRVYDL